MIYIYSILNKNTNKSYIGKTINPSYRKRRHFQLLKNNKHPNIKLQRSYNKHGSNAFKFFIIFETNDIENWGKYESLFISLFNTRDDNFGYNIGKGGESNMITKEIQSKQKQSNKNRWPNVYQISMITNTVINIYQSCNEAFTVTGIAHISDVCNLKYKSAGGYYWCYEHHWNNKWEPPLHGKAKPFGLFKNNKLVEVFRNRDNCRLKEAFNLFSKKKPINIDNENILKFISKDEWYNFVLNQTCND